MGAHIGVCVRVCVRICLCICIFICVYMHALQMVFKCRSVVIRYVFSPCIKIISTACLLAKHSRKKNSMALQINTLSTFCHYRSLPVTKYGHMDDSLTLLDFVFICDSQDRQSKTPSVYQAVCTFGKR